MNRIPDSPEEISRGRNVVQDFRLLSQRITNLASRGVPRFDFMHGVSESLLDASGADAVELRQRERSKYFRCEIRREERPSYTFEVMDCVQDAEGNMLPCGARDSKLERFCVNFLDRKIDPSSPFFTTYGSFFIEDIENPVPSETTVREFDLSGESDYRSLALIPIEVDDQKMGMLLLKSKETRFFNHDRVEFFELVARTLGVAIVHRRSQVALRERIKELTCLYGIAKLGAKPEASLEETLQGIVELLPPGWLYPEIASARIILDDRSYVTSGFTDGPWKMTGDIIIETRKRGVVEVAYSKEMPELDEGPFLKEERNLIDTIAREVAVIIERKRAEEEKIRLQNQLLHADRLATIGQLAAGVAHELNEPLGTILGFAQLSRKQPGLPEQVARDLEKIENASLFAREVIKKLMIFARRMPPKKIRVDLNQVVEESLYFFESRAVKAGVQLRKLLSPKPPELTADPAQLTQILVNLVVNALQAMPDGGTLTVRTMGSDDSEWVTLTVEDTGIGMPEEIKSQIFLPFFTTKHVNEGTGLGLAVVHGIVTSHGGTIGVSSEVGRGSRFEIRLPMFPKEEENGGNDGE